MKKLLTALSLGLVFVAGAQAQAWPAKPVTLLVPFPPGGSTDMIARTLAPKLQEKLGGTFIVENKAGATGTVGAGQVKRAAPDGYTILVSSLGPYVIAPHLIKYVPYDALKDFDYLTVAVQAPNVLAVPAASPHKSLADVIAYHKANPGKMSFASSGNGSSDHLTAELFWQQTGTSGLHIPYKGGAPAMADLLGAQVDATFMNINTGITNIKGGKLRALAITSAERASALPEVPTLHELLGSKLAVQEAWSGLWAPARTPPEVMQRLFSALGSTLKTPAARKIIEAGGGQLAASASPQAYAEFIRAESAKWTEIVRLIGLTPN